MKCKKIFSAIQFDPFIEKIIIEKDGYDNLKKRYDVAISSLSGMYELRENTGSAFNKEGKLLIDINSQSQSFVKINPERIEIQRMLDDDNSFADVIGDLNHFYNIHKRLFKSKSIKFGIVKLYDILDQDFNINRYCFDPNSNGFSNGKSFVLLKRDKFNINIEFQILESKQMLKIDINDIIEPGIDYNWEHMNLILQLHKETIEKYIPEIYGSNK